MFKKGLKGQNENWMGRDEGSLTRGPFIIKSEAFWKCFGALNGILNLTYNTYNTILFFSICLCLSLLLFFFFYLPGSTDGK